MNEISLKNIVWKEGKYYVAQCLDFDVSSFGLTKKNALKNLNEALSLYFDQNPKLGKKKNNLPEIVETVFQFV